MRRKVVAVCGDALIEEGGKKFNIAFETGKALIDRGYRVQTGGGWGVMRAAFAGAHASEKYREGDTIGILPYFDRQNTNEYTDTVVATGLDMYRNLIVANADAVIVVGGGAGTLSEAAFAWTLKRLVIAYKNVDGWSAKIADTRIDNRIRYENIPEDRVYGAESAEEAVSILDKYIDGYTDYHKGIVF